MNKRIAIIGMGHMGKAFCEGLLFSGIAQETIITSDTAEENIKVASDADWVLLALKPHVVNEVLADIKEAIGDKIVLSVACGVTIAAMKNVLGNDNQKIIRLMPNLPVAYGKGVIGYYNSDSVSYEEKNEVVKILSGLGSVIPCTKEEELDAMTILSGSGPAIVAYCLSLFEKAGESFGFEKDEAQQIAYQTFLGTLELLKQKQQTAQALQEAVATKGGTTEAIIKKLDEEQIASRFQKSFETGYARIKEIKKT
ncbi:MAG TPA: pyrroline-5-carboxylate reductase [Patescibacteria group bacterium]|nr:pyrroline-5-carboxylate reductase [Patescibacteria group bacterium]